jgi:DNA-binding transcriptional regulator GbsR (MarR family)
VKALRSLNARGGHLQDFTEILDVCLLPRTKFQILEETGMSMRHLHFCLKYLLKQSLVKYHHRKRTYVTTKEGLRISQQLPHG